MKQVALLGEAGEGLLEAMKKIVQSEYRPNLIMAVTSLPIQENAPALLNDRILIQSKPTAYVCEGFVCKRPTTEIEVLITQLSA